MSLLSVPFWRQSSTLLWKETEKVKKNTNVPHYLKLREANAEDGLNPGKLAFNYRSNRPLAIKWKGCQNHESCNIPRTKSEQDSICNKISRFGCCYANARAKGHRVKFDHLWSKGRVFRREMTGDPNAIIRKYVIVNFIKRNNIRMCSRQRNRNISKDSFREKLQQWHVTYRERLVRTGYDESFNVKWGRFTPEKRLNINQSPCPYQLIWGKLTTSMSQEKTKTTQRYGYHNQEVAGINVNVRCKSVSL